MLVISLLLIACHPEPACFLPEGIAQGPEVIDGFDNDCDGSIDQGATETHYEGCGAEATGGLGGEIFEVTTLDFSGPGSLLSALTERNWDDTGEVIPRIVRFSVGGTIRFSESVVIELPYLTVDGASAPEPGITLTPEFSGILLDVGPTHDIILSHLRLVGDWVAGDVGVDDVGLLNVNGRNGNHGRGERMVFDHLTITAANDVGLDLWGELQNITLSWSLFYANRHPTTVSFHPAPFAVRDCISIHHNLYSGNEQRNPQIRADSRRVDVVNNYIRAWGGVTGISGSGLKIRAEPGEPPASVNVRDNLFEATQEPEMALVYGELAGAEDDGGEEGSVMGELFVEGNILPAEVLDRYSTILAPLEVPEVTRFDPATLSEQLPWFAGSWPRGESDTDMLKPLR